ncbi:MAG TPA: sigma-70 family RNA polymerase sigma factor [Solirubrobacteraceae bacterium]|nr:sigma-70 family RNA polymerase sigma factor [Solirubrobacteraceae bacterium]
MSERLLTRAARGDEEAFRELTKAHRRELQLHCYRMLGSMPDAEDALQETLLGAWRGLEGFEGRSSLRSWLYRIATNRCLNLLRSAERRPPTPIDPPFTAPEPTRVAEPTWLEPYPDAMLADVIDASPGPDARYETRETIELAFIAALQQLPPRQRAALVLRDVLGFRTSEVASMLESSEEAVKGALKRARATLEQDPVSRERARPPAADSARERELVRRFVEAFESDDIDALVALLTEDAWVTMPPSPLEYQGHVAITAFLRQVAAWHRGKPRRLLVPTRANSQPAFACYRPDDHSPVAHATGLIVLTLEGDHIAAYTHFVNVGLLSSFGLPRTLTT